MSDKYNPNVPANPNATEGYRAAVDAWWLEHPGHNTRTRRAARAARLAAYLGAHLSPREAIDLLDRVNYRSWLGDNPEFAPRLPESTDERHSRAALPTLR